MPQFIRNFIAIIGEAKQAAATILALVMGLMVLWGSYIWPWLLQLSLGQRIFLSIAAFSLLFILALWIWDWFEKRAIQKIPNILFQLDQITLDLIDEWETPQDVPEQVLDELAAIFAITGDVGRLKSNIKTKNTTQIRAAIDNIAAKYAGNAKKRDSMQKLAQAGALMDEHGIGLECLRQSDEKYHRLYSRVRQLQQRIPNAKIGIAINSYFRTSDVLYSMLLSSKPIIEGTPEIKELLSVKIRADARLMRQTVEEQTELLVINIREEIQKSKNHDKQSGN